MSPEEAAARLDGVLAHVWMVRTFLKHAEEIAADPDMLDVPRTVFDYVRAAEPARQRGDLPEFFRRLRGKLGKLRRAAAYLAENHRKVSDHTNWQMAAASLSACVAALDEVLAAVPPGESPPPGP